MIDIDEMFFSYCILLKRSADEFWNSRPSQIIYCVEKYQNMINKDTKTDEPEVITSMREIPGWGDRA